MKVKITKMTNKHIPDVIKMLSETFSMWFHDKRGVERPHLRKPETIIPYLKYEPNGCLVAIDKGKIIGAIFGHTWGKAGWIGTFGVSPTMHSKGIGKELMLKIMDYLDKEMNVTSLSLETMPDSPYNIALYSKLGFRPAFPTIRLNREIQHNKTVEKNFTDFAAKNKLETTLLSKEENIDEIFTRCNWLADKISNGLKHETEFVITKEYSFGDTILVKQEGFIIAYALVYNFAKYENREEDTDLEIKIAVLDTNIKDPKYFDYLIYACELYAKEIGKTGIKIRVNSSYWLAYKHLLDIGFQVKSSLLRMTRYSDEIKSYDHHHEWIIDCSGRTM